MNRLAWVWLGLLVLGVSACSRPSPSFAPTAVPVPPSIRELPGRGVAVEGHGTAETDEVAAQYDGGISLGIDVVALTHTGQSTFMVSALQGNQSQLLISALGPYTGQRPLVIEGPVSFQVTADGDWTLTITPMSRGGQPAYSGTSDGVSAYFAPPSPSTWDVSHDGQSNFFVYAHCVGGSVVVEDRMGAFTDTTQVQFPAGPCFWEVRADGSWSLAPSSSVEQHP